MTIVCSQWHTFDSLNTAIRVPGTVASCPGQCCLVPFCQQFLHALNNYYEDNSSLPQCMCNAVSLIKVSLALNLEYCSHACEQQEQQQLCQLLTIRHCSLQTMIRRMGQVCIEVADRVATKKREREGTTEHRQLACTFTVCFALWIHWHSLGLQCVCDCVLLLLCEHLPSADANISWLAVSLLCRCLPASIFSSFNCLI